MVTNSAIWLVLYAIRIFSSLPTATVTLKWVFVLLFAKSIKVKKLFFQTAFYCTRKLKNKSFLFKQIFIAILKWRNSCLQHRFVYCICKARRVCPGVSERMKKLILESEEKIKKLIFCRLRLGPYSKKPWPRCWKCCAWQQPEGSIFKTDFQYLVK